MYCLQNINFQVDTNSLYLKEEFGDLSFWANEAGRFNTVHLDDGSLVVVMGDDIVNT